MKEAVQRSRESLGRGNNEYRPISENRLGEYVEQKSSMTRGILDYCDYVCTWKHLQLFVNVLSFRTVKIK